MFVRLINSTHHQWVISVITMCLWKLMCINVTFNWTIIVERWLRNLDGEHTKQHKHNFSFHTPWHVFPPPHFFTNFWSIYSKLNPSTVTMVVFCNNMEGGSLFMKMFLGVNIITSSLNMSVAGGESWWISLLGPQETFISGLCTLDTQKVVNRSVLFISISLTFSTIFQQIAKS
jgi:hypothetical protein